MPKFIFTVEIYLIFKSSMLCIITYNLLYISSERWNNATKILFNDYMLLLEYNIGIPWLT